ncbi:uncharacterized protein LOC131681809 [Topomyia yanbarensis]|uniref:uncharacterized protein LOC131681809 n=1 Tax=Topomyia yanbarensis TaxID=2498891 RepID=UPI00273BFE3E|nr:uncharacterized protein LOC131681809 [Topomyia yanbarensis]
MVVLLNILMTRLLIIFLSCLLIGSAVEQYESPKITDSNEFSLMFPNERTSLDDCHLRFYKLNPDVEVKPVFGKPVPLKEFAHMGAIGWTQRSGNILWQCGGTLIWDNFVLTAAHCAVDSSNQAPDVVRFGDINLFSSDDDKYAQQLKIVNVIRHPMHKFSANYHDIALVKLEKSVRLHDTVAPACLWLDKELRFRKLEATGWGRTGFAQEQTPVLLKVTLKPISNEQCSQFYSSSINRKLRFGLHEQHICAVDERMDTCEGDSGGPLQIKLMHNSKVTPFVVGITSFGSTCGTSTPGVYTRVADYHGWIVSTMREKGAAVDENTFNATFCALRYLDYREYEDAVIVSKSAEFTSYNSANARINVRGDTSQLAKIGWDSDGRGNCFGVIVDEDTVLTIADCTHFKGSAPTILTYGGNNTAVISKIHVHPGYIEGSAYDNIAILKLAELLDLPIGFQPSCIWHGNEIPYTILRVMGYGRIDMSDFALYKPILLDPTETFLHIQARVFNESSCVLPNSYLRSLPRGFSREHICVGNDVFLVPESCRPMLGASVAETMGINYRKYHITFALNQQSRDCGFGEYMLATRLSSHIEWLKSVLLPSYQDTSSTLRFLDPDLQEGSSCENDAGLEGRCVTLANCSVEWPKFLAEGTAKFCSSSNVICCPLTNIKNADNSPIHLELLECPKLVKRLAVAYPPGSMVKIGWIHGEKIEFRCYGAIITKLIIIVSASCLSDGVPQFVQLVANVPRKSFDIDSILLHKDYNSTENSNDIALVRLRRPLAWSEDVFPTCLWTNESHVPLVMKATFEGNNKRIGYDFVAPMYNSDCQRSHPRKIHRSQICARSYKRKSTCISMSDQLRWDAPDGVSYLVGLIAHASDCVNWRYAVFTRITSFLDWISAVAF